MALLNRDYRERATLVSNRANVLELAEHPEFETEFFEAMDFPDQPDRDGGAFQQHLFITSGDESAPGPHKKCEKICLDLRGIAKLVRMLHKQT